MNALNDLLLETSKKYKDQIALQYRSFLRTEKYSYEDLYKTSRQLAKYLREKGLETDQKVIIWADNSPKWVLSYFGILLAGGVAVPATVHISEDVVEKYIKKTKAKLVIANKILVGGKKELASTKVIFIEDILDSLPNDEVSISRDSEDLAQLVFTSGTTGEPKGVMISYKNIHSALEMILPYVPSKKVYRILSILPLSHVMEQMVGLFAPLKIGATIYYVETLNPVTIKKALYRYKITNLGAVPQILRMFYDGIEFEAAKKNKLSTLQKVISIAQYLPIEIRRKLFSEIHKQMGGELREFVVGSAPLDVELAKTWESMGFKVIEGYGASETTAVISVNTSDKRVLGSVGKPINHIKVKLDQESKEILAKSDSVTSGYYNDIEKTKSVFTDDGFYKTGDIGYFDKQGYLYINGRDKFKIVTAAGDKVYPEDVERVINKHPNVKNSCVFGIEKSDGEIVCASIILKSKGKNIKDVIEEINAGLEDHQKILEYRVWEQEDFPRLHTLKVDRNKVKESIVDNKPVEAHSKSKTSDALKLIIAEVCKFPQEKIADSLNLETDLKVNSLKKVTIVSLIEQNLGVEIDEGKLGDQTTIKDLRKLVKNSKKNSTKSVNYLDHWSLKPLTANVRSFLQKSLLFPIQKYVTSPTFIGLENLENISGPAICVFNHVGHFDSTLVIRSMNESMRKRIFAVADARLYKSKFNSLMLYCFANSFPIDKINKTDTKKAFEFIGDMFEQNKVLIIAPEGDISPNGTLQDFKEGPFVLAVEAGVPIIPFIIDGYTEAYPKKKSFPYLPEALGKVTVKIGAPIHFDKGTDIKEATDTVRKVMLEM